MATNRGDFSDDGMIFLYYDFYLCDILKWFFAQVLKNILGSLNYETQSTGNKKEKKRGAVGEKLIGIEREFALNREAHFRRILSSLQKELQELHDGTHKNFLDGFADLEDDRDKELSRIKFVRDYGRENAKREYLRELQTAKHHFEETKKDLRERLLQSISNRRKRLREDKLIIDTANDSYLLLHSSSSGAITPSANDAQDRRKLRHRGKGLQINSNTAADSANESVGTTGGIVKKPKRGNNGNYHERDDRYPRDVREFMSRDREKGPLIPSGNLSDITDDIMIMRKAALRRPQASLNLKSRQ